MVELQSLKQGWRVAGSSSGGGGSTPNTISQLISSKSAQIKIGCLTN